MMMMMTRMTMISRTELGPACFHVKDDDKLEDCNNDNSSFGNFDRFSDFDDFDDFHGFGDFGDFDDFGSFNNFDDFNYSNQHWQLSEFQFHPFALENVNRYNFYKLQ